MKWWFWHLVYDNPLFGRRLWKAVREFKFHRNLGDTEYSIYGLNYRWQQQQRRYIIREHGDYKLISPRSRI